MDLSLYREANSFWLNQEHLSLFFFDTEGSSPFSQESSIRPYPEPDELSEHIRNFFFKIHFNIILPPTNDHLCGLVVRVPGYRSRGPALPVFFWEVTGSGTGPLSLVSKIEDLLRRKSSGSDLENLDYDRGDPLCLPCKKFGTNFADKRLSLGRYSCFCFIFLLRFFSYVQQSTSSVIFITQNVTGQWKHRPNEVSLTPSSI
jgi:hypothetical protein